MHSCELMYVDQSAKAYPISFPYWPNDPVRWGGVVPTTRDGTAICSTPTFGDMPTIITPPQAAVQTGFPQAMRTDDPAGLRFVLVRDITSDDEAGSGPTAL